MKIFRYIHRRFCFFLINHVYAGTPFFERKRKLLNSLGHQIATGTKVVGPIEISGSLIVGQDCWIGKNFRVNGNGCVIIGDRCDIGPEVTFNTGGHEIGDAKRRAGDGRIFNQQIGNGCWIGGGSTFFNDCKIGDSCVIAGCSCVTKDVDSNLLVAGVPAQPIRRL